jgi:zinc and cadmium transporter
VGPLAVALGLSLLGSLGGLLLAWLLLLFHDRLRLQLVPWLVSYAVGALLGVALLALLPEALESLPSTRVLGFLLAGILIFFVLEKLVLWRHCHTHDCEVHGSTNASLVLIGDAFHNFIDGAVICAAVLTSVPLGVNTALAVAAHEIPQEVGDFAILLHSGYSRAQALRLNVLSGTSGLLGALVAYATVDGIPAVQPYLLTFAAASFLYIAMADLIPDLHRGRIDAKAFRQMLLVGAGIATVMAF